MNDLKITEKTLDFKKVFKEKAPVLGKWLPGFVYSYVRKKVHEKELNEFLFENKEKMGLDFVESSLEILGLNFEVIGYENLPATGRYTLAANHPLGGPEGLGLMKIVGDVRKDFSFLANDILMSIPNLKMLFTPVNKHGSNSNYVDYFNQAFESDKMILIFPAGLVSRKQDGKIRDFFWKSSFITRAIKNDRGVVPVHIDGKNSNFFYNLARIRTKLKIKANLEMFLLSDEMFKQRGKTIKVTIGKAIDQKIFDSRMNNRKWAALVKEYVYDLKNNPSLIFNNEYIEANKHKVLTDK